MDDDRNGLERTGQGRAALTCVPDAIDAGERAEHFARIERLFGRSVRERAPVGEGYDFIFDVEELGELVAFVRLERRCCPSLSFQLDVVAGSDEVRLRVHGPRGARALIEAELIGREAEP